MGAYLGELRAALEATKRLHGHLKNLLMERELPAALFRLGDVLARALVYFAAHLQEEIENEDPKTS